MTLVDSPVSFAPSVGQLERLKRVYRAMITAREIDRTEKELVRQGLAFFQSSGTGHEAAGALASHLLPVDWLHLHYRDKSLVIARGREIGEFFRSLLARRTSCSAGRQFEADLSAPERNVVSFSGPVANSALMSVGIAASLSSRADHPIVVCSVGDGTSQEGEFLEAIAEAVRWNLRVMFLVEDNRYAISTRTRSKTWFDLPDGPSDSFYGTKIHYIDGTNVVAADTAFGEIVREMRTHSAPQLVVLRVERLTDHSSADDETKYRDAVELARGRAHGDPVPKLREYLVAQGTPAGELAALEHSVRGEVQAALEDALRDGEPDPVFTAKAPLPEAYLRRDEYRGESAPRELTMREAINGVLRRRLAEDPRVCLYGLDIEDPKGDVFGVTRGLSTEFPRRVVSAPLSESTIIGTCIGRALTGQRPVAFIQFADFLPLAYNQILSELGSMFWRTNGGWQCPVIIMVTCGGYKPGLGTFHSQTLESVLAHTPGVDVVMPSCAADAAGLLNAAFDSPRPTVFYYPKSCLNLPDRTTSTDLDRHFVPVGRARRVSAGDDLTLVTWGNPLAQCELAAAALVREGFSVDLIDLRSLSPWDDATVLASAEATGRLVVVHEDNLTCGMGGEILATVAERSLRPVRMRRITRADTFIPYHFGNQLDVLPSFRRILDACADLLDCDVTWAAPVQDPPGQVIVRAFGPAPSDETVDVVEITVRVGDEIQKGQVVAVVEATKSVVDVDATAAGIVREVYVSPGQRIAVGGPLVCITTSPTGTTSMRPPMSRENAGRPRLQRRQSNRPTRPDSSFDAPAGLAASAPDVVAASDSEQAAQPNQAAVESPTDDALRASRPAGPADGPKSSPASPSTTPRVPPPAPVYLSRPVGVVGGRLVSTAEIVDAVAGWSTEEAVKRTGVETRHWMTADEDVMKLTMAAVNGLVARLGTDMPPLSLIACSATNPKEATPSIACQVATTLASRVPFQPGLHAYDFNAACSGFLYGVRFACDHLAANPEGAVLLLTAEGLSPMVNRQDPATCFLFGDAATATLITSRPCRSVTLQVASPECFATPDPTKAISAPCQGAPGYLQMDGIAVARVAYKGMANALRRSAARQSVAMSDLALLLPHPGSKRILDNVAELLEIDGDRVRHTLASTGNTSSSSIPLALDRHWDSLPVDRWLGFAAFGAGFTSAATVGKLLGDIRHD